MTARTVRSGVEARRQRRTADVLSDIDYLELIVRRTRCLTPRDKARTLLKNFGTLPACLTAPSNRLRELGMPKCLIRELDILRSLPERVTRARMELRPIMSTNSYVIDYCRAAMAYEQRESFRVLFLNKKNLLIADELQQTGTVDHVEVYPREVIRRALDLSACAIILVHNHPSGDPSPSRIDVEMTNRLQEAASYFSISVVDHIIVAGSGHSSLREMELI